MRHFEIFELEHLLNSTGGVFFRWRCRRHLKKCPICKARMEQVVSEQHFAARFRSGLLKFCRPDWQKDFYSR